VTATSTTTSRTTRAPRARQAAPGVEAIDAEIDERCAELRLPTIRERFGDIADEALRDRANYKGFLLELLRAECAERDDRRKARLVRDAAFHRPKRLETFEYDKNPNVDPVYVNNLANPEWVNAGAPLCLLGNSGTGKSHLLIGIGTAIAEHGLKVRYTTTANLVNELAEPPTKNGCPKCSTATPATTCSAWMNSAVRHEALRNRVG
jgi:DNA replication protein DnaC